MMTTIRQKLPNYQNIPLNSSSTIDGKLWIGGTGNVAADTMVIATGPDYSAIRGQSASYDEACVVIRNLLGQVGIEFKDVYFTYLVKFPISKAKASKSDVIKCRDTLYSEVLSVNPKVIITCGSEVWNGLDLGADINFSDVKNFPVRGTLRYTIRSVEDTDDVESTLESEDYITKQFLPIFNPGYVEIRPNEREGILRALKYISTILVSTSGVGTYIPEYMAIDNKDKLLQVSSLITTLKETSKPVVAIDCEWHGPEWYKNNPILRSVQFCINGKATFILPLTRVVQEEGKDPEIVKVWDDVSECKNYIRSMLTDTLLIGHNMKDDIQWLNSCTGIDLTEYSLYDTMLAETLINQNGPFGLEDLALKYTDIGRWSIDLNKWYKKAKPAFKKHGFGYIPDDVLEPYAAVDVIATYEIMVKQIPLLREMGYLNNIGEYPSLMRTAIDTQNALIEIERTGLPVDKIMLSEMIRIFEGKRDALRGDLIGSVEMDICEWLSMKPKEELSAIEIYNQRKEKGKQFNPGSSKQVQELLFKVYKITPFKTTKSSGGKLWEHAVSDIGLDDVDALDELSAATDTLSMTILSDEHPIIPKLLDFKRIDQMVKTWLCTPQTVSGYVEGGLTGNLGVDGSLHPTFRMGLATGRLATSNPNSQNFPKQANRFMDELFEFELHNDPWLKTKGSIPSIRNIIVPPPGYVIIEGDFVQAELFVLAGLSNDSNMLKVLNTPGMDLHDQTAITAFGLRVVDSEDRDVPEEYLIQLAAKYGSDSDEFNHFVTSLRYVDTKGHILCRKEFKDTVRVSAKSVNFGIPYGRGASSIAQQVKSETGSSNSLSSITSDIDKAIHGWKTKSYPTAWEYMSRCSYEAQNNFEVRNPWGRARRFIPTTDKTLLASYGRQGSNFPIQSTVADACNIASNLMRVERDKRGIDFKLCNLVHDAIMVFALEDSVEDTLDIFRCTMGNIKIPLGEDRDPLVLGIDLEIQDRWGVPNK